MADQHYVPNTAFGDQVEATGSQERIENYDVIFRHDHALMNYMKFYIPFREKATGKIFDQMVPTVFATPRREWSEQDIHEGTDERYTTMEWIGDFPPTQLERLSYPNIAVTRLDATFDQVRWSYTPWRKILYSSDLNLALESNFPLPYNFQYQFDFWALEQAHMNNFIEQWARKFPRPTHWLDIQFPPPWGTKTVHMQASPVFSNTSTFEGGEQQRELRLVGTVNVLGWIPLPTRWVRTVQQFTFEMIDEASGDIMATYETERASKKLFWETGDKNQVLTWK